MNGLALCAGGGGLEAGLQIVLPDQYRTVCIVERQAYAAASLVARMGKAGMDEAPVWDDVTTFNGKPWRGIVDIITGGYPCQPFSNAGECLAENDPRYIWPAIRRIVREVNPRWLFFENVAAHLTRGFARIRRELQEDGYKVEAGIFAAEEVGAPHVRERLFILAELAYTPDTGFSQRGCSGQQAQSEETVARLVSKSERLSSPGPQPLADSKSLGRAEGWTQHAIEQGGGLGLTLSGGQVGNTYGERKSQPGRSQRQGRRRTEYAGEILAHTDLQRTQIPFAGRQPAEQESCGCDSQRIFEFWPAGPGEFQHEWEEPRTVKPGVGGVTYGVGQRSEQLCLLGNGVVPVAAALAFVALWGRMRNND